MTKRAYPYVSGRKKLRHWPECILCGRQSQWCVTIQTSWFRSDDEVAYVCHGHREAKPEDIINALIKEHDNDEKLSNQKNAHGGPHRGGLGGAKDERQA